MADENDNKPPIQSSSAAEQADVQTSNVSSTHDVSSIHSPSSSTLEDRSGLLERARIFLNSPQVRYEEPVEKRKFLVEKGLNEEEIEGLMRELPQQLPTVPPKTYPQPPPSNLPYVLMRIMRILTWITGTSAVLIYIYYRFLLPRIRRSSLARLALKQHQVGLLKRLNSSLADLKSTQSETFSQLPSIPPTYSKEPTRYSKIHSVDDLDINPDAAIEVSEFTFMRCLIEELSAAGKKPTKEELFTLLREKYPWLQSEKGVEYETSLWQILTTDACFSESNENGKLVWSYIPPSIPPSSEPLLSAVTALRSSFPPPRQHSSTFQHTLDALAGFTGYITTQTHNLVTRSLRIGYPGIGMGIGDAGQLGPREEEVRREIRALKGLVLNRRTFASSRFPVVKTPQSS